MTLPARHLLRRRTARSRLALALPLAVSVAMSLVLATTTAGGASAASVSGTARGTSLPPMIVGSSGPDVTVEPAGRTYVSSSSTVRPLLVLTGWTDLAGQPLDAEVGDGFAHVVEFERLDDGGD